VKVSQHKDFFGESLDTLEEEYDASFDSSFCAARDRYDGYSVTSQKDNIFNYCVIASLVLHVAFLGGVPQMAMLAPSSPPPRPAEKVTSVRLVEPRESEKKQEPPPETASAISDRDHTAVSQKLPKILPSFKAPLGSVDSGRQRLAALTPPIAPEDLIKPEQKTEKDDQLKPSNTEKPSRNDKRKEKQAVRRDHEKPNQRGHRIDLTPTPEEIAKGLSSFGGDSEFFPEGDADEIVVDINTREDRFFSYLLHLKKKIQDVWVYPHSAAQHGIGGALTIEFAVANDGKLLYANLVDSSGHSILDQYALRAIETAAPYFPFPARMKAKRLKVRANFIYITSNYFRRIM